MDRLAQTLRKFGIVDRFDLAELFAGDGLPSHKLLVRRLISFREALPSGVTAELLASRVLSDLLSHESAGGSNAFPASEGDFETLSDIPPGNEGAHKFQKLIGRIVTLSLSSQLTLVKEEAKQHNGRKRIDLLYRNDARPGFFEALVKTYQVKSPFIPIECKNYSSDPGNEEFDQLSGRLNDKIGAFGILICREIKDKALMLARRTDYTKKGEYLIALDDSDIETLIVSRARETPGDFDELLHQRMTEISLA